MTYENCTSNEVKSDSESYSMLNCEFIVGYNIYFYTIYVGADEIFGGVAEKKQYDAWLEMENRGFLMNRWLTHAKIE